MNEEVKSQAKQKAVSYTHLDVYKRQVYYHSEKLEAKTEVKAKKEAAVFAEHLVQEKEEKK